MAIDLRPIRESDLSILFEIYSSTRQGEIALLDWTKEQKAAFLKMQFEAQHKHYQSQFVDAEFFLILGDKAPIGRLYVDRREEEIRIVDIALLPEYRGKGIGARLLRDILDEGTRVHKPVRIHVEKNNPALGLYKRLGFVEVGDTGVYYLMERLPASVDD